MPQISEVGQHNGGTTLATEKDTSVDNMQLKPSTRKSIATQMPIPSVK
jgi:hypothetical protein